MPPQPASGSAQSPFPFEQTTPLVEHLARVGSWRWTLATNTVEWSDGMYALFGVERAGFTGDLASIVDATTHPDDRARLTSEYQRILTGGRPEPLDFRLRSLDGQPRTVRTLFGQPTVDHAGGAVLVGVVQDITDLRTATLQAEAFSRRFEQLLDCSIDHIFAKDREFRLQYASQSVAGASGHAHWRDLVGKLDSEVFPHALVEAYRRDDEVVLRTGRPALGTLVPFRGAQGESRIVESSKWPELERDGQVVGIIGIGRDVTEREQSAARVRASELRYRTAVDALHEGLAVQDASGAIISVNPAACRIMGLTHDQLTGLTSLDPRWQARHLNGTPFPGHEHPAMVALGTGEPQLGVPMVLSRANGDDAFIEINAVPLFENGVHAPTGVVTTFVDVTARQAAVAAADREATRYRTLITIARDGLHVLDRRGRLVESNDAFLASLGYRRDEAAGLSVADWEASLTPAALPARITELLEAPGVFETLHRRKDGSTFDAEVSAGAVVLDGETYLLAFSRDVSARKSAERNLRDLLAHLEQRVAEEVERAMASERALIAQSRLAAMGEMLGNIAHQWRQPLNALALVIANLADDADAGLATPDAVADAALEARQLIAQMSTTISDFTNFFRPGKSDEVFEVRAVVADLVSMVTPAFLRSGVTIECLPGEPMVTRGVSNEYGQVLLNLLTNARDAVVARRETERRIVISMTRTGGHCRVSVSDNGGGVTLTPVARVFEPYISTKDHGTGLGLYLSKKIIEESLGGSLHVENTGDGATFTIVTHAVEVPHAL